MPGVPGTVVEFTAPLRAASSDSLVEYQRCADGGFRRDNRCAHARGSRDPARIQRRFQRGAVAYSKLHGGKARSMGDIGRIAPEVAAEGSRIHYPRLAPLR